MKFHVLLCIFGVISFGCSQSTDSQSPVPFTAASKLSEINSAAQSYNKGLRLMLVKSDGVDTEGRAATWHYMYVDTAMPPATYWFHADYRGVGFDSTSVPLVGAAVITHDWFNSDTAMQIAERNGGSQFRAANPNYVITASVGEPVVPNPATTWWIEYRSAQDHSVSLLLGIDATTGDVTLKYPE